MLFMNELTRCLIGKQSIRLLNGSGFLVKNENDYERLINLVSMQFDDRDVDVVHKMF